MTRRSGSFALALALACTAVTPAAARTWTPHTAAAVLDATFPSAPACQAALEDARRRADRAEHVNGLTYARLFEQGRCHGFRHDGVEAWRIRMHWAPRAAKPAADRPQPLAAKTP